MGNDKEEANTWFEIGFEDEAWKREKNSVTFHTMREEMREEKGEEAGRKRNERELSEWLGYYSLVGAANLVAGLPESTALRTSLPNYLIWAKARNALERGWRVPGGLTCPKEDLPIPVRQVQQKEGWFVCLSDFIEWAIEVGCPIAHSAIETARRECELSDTFESRARLWEIEQTLTELRVAKTERVEGILTRDARLAELERERGEILSLLKGDEPESERSDGPAPSGGANAIPSPAAKSCIPCPPKNKDDWYLVIRDAAIEFHAKHGRCPQNKTEMWAWLNSNPPSGYRITSGRDKGGEKALFSADGSTLGKRAFSSRWNRYTHGPKEYSGT